MNHHLLTAFVTLSLALGFLMLSYLAAIVAFGDSLAEGSRRPVREWHAWTAADWVTVPMGGALMLLVVGLPLFVILRVLWGAAEALLRAAGAY